MPGRTVIPTGDAESCACRGWDRGRVAPELGSLSNSGAGTIFVEGSERKKTHKRGVGSASKSLTSVLIFPRWSATRGMWIFVIAFSRKKPIQHLLAQKETYRSTLKIEQLILVIGGWHPPKVNALMLHVWSQCTVLHWVHQHLHFSVEWDEDGALWGCGLVPPIKQDH